MAIYFRKQEQTLKGIVIISGITFLLTGSICGRIGLPLLVRETEDNKYYCESNKLYSEYTIKPIFRNKIFERFAEKTELYDFSKSNSIRNSLDCCNNLASLGFDFRASSDLVIPAIGKNFNGLYYIQYSRNGKILKPLFKPLCQMYTASDPVIELEKISIYFVEYYSKYLIKTKPNGSKEFKIKIVNVDKLKEEEAIYYQCSLNQPLQKEECK